MVGSEQVYHSPVSQYGGSKPKVVNKNNEKLERLRFRQIFMTDSERANMTS